MAPANQVRLSRAASGRPSICDDECVIMISTLSRPAASEHLEDVLEVWSAVFGPVEMRVNGRDGEHGAAD